MLTVTILLSVNHGFRRVGTLSATVGLTVAGSGQLGPTDRVACGSCRPQRTHPL